VALVTGAAAGIGQAAALRLAEAGAALFLVDRDADGLERTAALIAQAGGRAVVHAADLSDRVAVGAVIDSAVAALDKADILINCAGMTGPGKPLLESDESAWDLVFAVNVTAPYLLIKRLGMHLVARGAPGRIVNITSSSAHRARMSVAAYGASKSALMQLTRTAAADLGPHNINVNAVAPGLTATQMGTGNFPAEMVDQIIKDGPISNLLGRVSEPEDIADTVLFLCLPASRQITGQTIHVSAGAIV
jgi:NAD(P)-dependent dehydrogenase (short-subunit alcohol dehydrogenase family)